VRECSAIPRASVTIQTRYAQGWTETKTKLIESIPPGLPTAARTGNTQFVYVTLVILIHRVQPANSMPMFLQRRIFQPLHQSTPSLAKADIVPPLRGYPPPPPWGGGER